MNVVVLGAGALGSLYGAWSADAGHDVVLVGRQRHADAVAVEGLTVRDLVGTSRTVPMRATTDAGAAGPADVVLVACKAPDTATLLAAYRGEPTAVWSVQNGVHQSRPLVDRYGAAAIGCVSMVGATLDGPGMVSHTFSGVTYLGPLRSSAREALGAVIASLGEVPSELRDDIEAVSWSKAVLAAAAMGMSVLLRLPYHHVFGEPRARRMFYDLVAEASSIAAAEGVALVDLPGPLQAGSLMALRPADALARLEAVGRAMVDSGQTSVRISMLQSLESGRRLEVDAVFGDLIDLADDHRLEVPLLRTVRDIVATLDDVIAREAGQR